MHYDKHSPYFSVNEYRQSLTILYVLLPLPLCLTSWSLIKLYIRSNKKRKIKIFLLENSLGKIITGSLGEKSLASLENKNGLLPLAKVAKQNLEFKLPSFSRINPVALIPIFMILILFQSMLQL